MKIKILTLVLILFLTTPVIAEQPRMEIHTNKNTYFAGETGTITAEIETFGVIKEAELEIEILSPEGKLVYGDILYTQVPEKTILNPRTEQTEQVLYHEDIGFMTSGKTIRRVIDFEVPIDVITGTYTISVRLTSPDLTLEESEPLYISGSGGVVDTIIIIYIAILIFSLYLAWRN